MKNALSRYLPIFCAIAIGTMTVRGQSPGNPAAVPIKMWATGGPISGGNGTTLLELQLSGAVPSSDFPGEFVNLSESGFSGSVTTPLATVQLIPNFLYSGELTVAYAHGSFYFAPPPGYDLLINGLPQRCWSYDAYSSKIDKSITVQLLRLDGNVPKAGVCSQIQSGMVSWQVSLGGQMNGTSAGYLSIVDSGTEATWSNVYTPGGLQYISPSTEVEPYINPTTGYLRQVLADQALVDIETISSTEYTISFYNIAQITGTVSPYTFTGQPFVQYTISQGLSGNNSLQITKITYETTSANDNPSQPALTQVTTLTRTGSGMNSYIWTLNKWNTSEQSQIAEETRTWGGQPGARTEGLVVNTPGDAAAATIGNDFATYNWGEELVSTAIGSTNTVTNSYTYYQGSNAANPGSYGFFESSISTDGSWVAYDYYNPATPTLTTGMLNHIYRPFNNSPNLVTQNTGAGDVTTLQWTIDPYGAPTRPYSELTQVNGVTTGYSQTAYTDNFTSVGIYLDGTIVTDYVTEAVTTASTDSVGTLTSTNKFFAENGIDPLVVSQPYSTIGPNGVQQSYAYLRGDFNASNYTFTADAQFGFSSSIAVITGSNNASSGGTSYSSYNGFPVDPIYLINGKSTMVVTIRDPLGLIRSTQSYAWLSGWQPTGTTNYAYDYAGNPVQITQPNGSVVTPAYNGQQMTSLTDASGIAFDYSYDYAGRVSSIAKVGGSTTNLLYDAVGRSTSKSVTNGSESISTAYTYDDAGRLTQVTPPGASAGLAAVSYSYAYSVNGTNDWTRTITYGDGGTKVETYQADGRLASLTGTAVIPEYYNYYLDATSSGFLDAKIYYGSSASARYTVSVVDWLGRTYSVTKQSFGGGTPFVVQNTYDNSPANSTAGTGHLLSTARTGYANTLYQYDAMGQLTAQGLDIAGTGALVTNSADRMTAYNTYVQSGSNGYWLQKDTTTYPTLNSANSLTTSVMQRLTGFSANQLQETMAVDEYTNTVDQSTTVNTSTKTVTATTTEPGFSNPLVTVTVNGLETQITGADNLTTQFGYDTLERQTTVTDTRGKPITTAYFSGSTLPYTVSDTSPVTLFTYGYDSAGRRNSSTDASGNVTGLTYSPLGLVLQQGGTGAYPIAYTYDVYGARQTMTTYWGSSNSTAETQWQYDPASGLLLSKTDPTGKQVTFTYNVCGTMNTRTWARPINNVQGNALVSTTYGYDSNTEELLTKVYNDGTVGVTYTYARSGQLATVADAVGTRTFNFDSGYGNQVDSESLDGTFYSGRVVTQLYDGTSGVSSSDNYNGQYQTATVSGRPSGFEFGSSGNPSRDIVQQLVHSNLGQLVGVNATNGTSATRNFVYTYLSNAELLSGYTVNPLANSNNFTVSCSYDSTRPLLTTNQGLTGGNVVTEFDYAYNGKRQRLTATQRGSAYADYFSGTAYNSVYNSYSYDAFGQLHSASMNTGNGSSQLPGRTFAYAYDSIGNRTSAGESSGSDDNQYVPNSLNQYSSVENEAVRVLGNTALGYQAQVTGATTAQVDRNYGADFFPANQSAPVQSSVTVTAGSANQNHNFFIPAQVQTLTYDADGNLLTDGVWNYSYDAENRLSGMGSSLPSGMGYTRLSLVFTYDYLGRRAEKSVRNIDTSQVTFDHRYIYSGWNPIAETDTSGHLIRSYAWGPGGANSAGSFIELTNFNYDGSWNLLGTTDYFATSDGNGNVASLVRYDGDVAAVYEYGPFGEPLRRETPSSDLSVSDNPIRFASNYTDSETGLVCYGQRYYSPSLGRFINRDPIEEAGGVNLYGFCGNDGINNFDVNGNSWLSKLWDHTILKIGQQAAINWDHGRSYVEMAAAIVASVFVGEEVDAWAFSEIYFSTDLSVEASLAGADVVAGAAGGFVSGVSLGAMSGENFGRALKSGLQGAEGGALLAGIGAGQDYLNGANGDTGSGGWLKVTDIGSKGGLTMNNALAVAGRGLEGAAVSNLEDKDASVGFWSGLASGAEQAFAPPQNAGLVTDIAEDAAKGVVGGLGSMNKHGKGFMTGFWGQEAGIATQTLATYTEPFFHEYPSLKDPFALVSGALMGGASSRLGGKTFSSGLFTGLGGAGLKYLFSNYIPVAGNDFADAEKPISGAVSQGYNLLQPKVGKHGISYPLDSIKGGYWAQGTPWSVLY